MGVQPKGHALLVSFTYRITGLHYTYACGTLSTPYVGYLYLENDWLHYSYGCATLSRAYVCNLYLQNNWVSFHLLLSYLN